MPTRTTSPSLIAPGAATGDKTIPAIVGPHFLQPVRPEGSVEDRYDMLLITARANLCGGLGLHAPDAFLTTFINVVEHTHSHS